MKRSRPNKSADALEDAMRDRWVAEMPKYLAGDVARILGVDLWRLQKFLASPRYRLSASQKLGEGQGSRRVFSEDDIYRIAIAVRLNHDGFAPKLIGQIMAAIKEDSLIDMDGQGEEAVLGITLSRSSGGPKLGFFRSGHPPEMKVGGSIYYALDVGEIIDSVNARISKLSGAAAGKAKS